MKKKHLRALNSLENWLKKQKLLNEEVAFSLETLKNTIEKVQEEEKEVAEGLPVPSEIAEDPAAYALFSDGGCRGNPGPGAFAYVIQDHSGTIVAEGVEFESHTTNNRMELSGPIHGLRQLKDILPGMGRDPLLSKVKIITDSKYVVDGMKSWVPGWKARGWKKADNKAPENLELWQELDKERQNFFEVQWQWVKGHGGHPQNEYCDKKANEPMDENLN